MKMGVSAAPPPIARTRFSIPSIPLMTSLTFHSPQDVLDSFSEQLDELQFMHALAHYLSVKEMTERKVGHDLTHEKIQKKIEWLSKDGSIHFENIAELHR